MSISTTNSPPPNATKSMSNLGRENNINQDVKIHVHEHNSFSSPKFSGFLNLGEVGRGLQPSLKRPIQHGRQQRGQLLPRSGLFLPQRRQPFVNSWSYSWTVSLHHHNSPLKALSKILGSNADNSSPVADCNCINDASCAWTLSRYATIRRCLQDFRILQECGSQLAFIVAWDQ
jgi:hypothetical protein